MTLHDTSKLGKSVYDHIAVNSNYQLFTVDSCLGSQLDRNLRILIGYIY